MKKIRLFFLILLFSYSSGLSTLYSKTDNNKITVRDSYNREVTLPANVERIGCLYAFSGHVVTMLGRGDSIVAVVRGLKRDKMLTKICPAILEAAVPNLNDSLNMEELARVKPDVVFIKDTVARKKSDTDTLTKLGIPYVVISFNSIEGQKKAVEIIGKAIGREKEASEYISYYNKCTERVKKITGRIPEDRKVTLYHSLLEPLKTDGHKGISTEWMDSAGVINVSARDKSNFAKEELFANIEQVLLWNPQVIITHEENAEETILMSKPWSTIDAVKNGRVYRMPNGISRWGHPGSLETPLAMLWTVKTIYPEYTKEIDLKKETMSFYKNFFNYTLSDNMADQILQGRGMRKSKKQGGH
jgi:iron complex transport system substrate-binding protein